MSATAGEGRAGAEPESTPRLRGERLAQLAVAVLLAVVAVLHVAAIHTENINWDEFALLDRAARSVGAQELVAGGRPGLSAIHLMPLVAGCSDEIATVRQARWLWSGWTILYVAGLWMLLVLARRGADHPWRGAALAVGLLVMVPVFLRWSLQVRSDQPALAGAVWGAAALLASRRRPALAVAAGVLFSFGFLFSQKAAYVIALAGLLAVADVLVEGDLRWRREIQRAVVCVLAAAGAVGLYLLVLAGWKEPPTLVNLEQGFDVFEFYRAAVGTRVYRGMLPTLSAHLVLGSLFAVACVVAVARHGRGARDRHLVVALAILALAWAVGWFHAGAFPYFWMTLGVFPAAAAGYALEGILGWLPSRRVRMGVLGVIAALLIASGLPAAVRLLADTQTVQAESLAFIGRQFSRGEAGFHPERAPFCRALGSPFPTYFTQHVIARFQGPQLQAEAAEFIQEFRDHQVHYILGSHRLAQFPAPVVGFWAQSYALYHSRVLVPVRSLAGAAGTEAGFEIIAPGRYTWHQRTMDGMGDLAVDGEVVAAGAGVDLDVGNHRASFSGGPVEGTLWWAVDEPPAPSAEPFYSEAVLAEFHGERPPWPRALLGHLLPDARRDP